MNTVKKKVYFALLFLAPLIFTVTFVLIRFPYEDGINWGFAQLVLIILVLISINYAMVHVLYLYLGNKIIIIPIVFVILIQIIKFTVGEHGMVFGVFFVFSAPCSTWYALGIMLYKGLLKDRFENQMPIASQNKQQHE